VPYTATVLRCMIASPGDVVEARDAVERALYDWNAASARAKSIITEPWRWETNAVPLLGDGGQALINSQGVDDSDIVFALFGSRLGSPTVEAVSGTVEEIERAVGLGKPVHLYFSTAPLPNDVDTAQLDGLRAFRKEMEDRGLLGEFSNAGQLNHEVWKALEHDINVLGIGGGAPPLLRRDAVQFRVQPGHEREMTGVDPKGRSKYTTRHWLDVTNDGHSDAENVVFEMVQRGNLHLHAPDQPVVIHRGQTRRLPAARFMGGGNEEPVMRIRWYEDGEEREKDFHVG
jgi:hypothetical protein